MVLVVNKLPIDALGCQSSRKGYRTLRMPNLITQIATEKSKGKKLNHLV